MGSIPPKAVSGQNFKKWVVETLNKLIDYLHGARIRPGYGIMVRETPSGTIVELAKKQAAPVNNATGGGAATIGFPDFLSLSKIIVQDTDSYPITENMWLIGRVQSRSYTGDPSFYLNVVETGSGATPISINIMTMGDENPSIFRDNFICIPIHSGLTISFTKDYIGTTASLILYPCI